jgi:HPt (histidine-containing phosphotransfer) domain-containing protein
MDIASITAATAIFGDQAGEFVRLTLKDADSFMAEIAAETQKGDALAAGLAAHSLKSILKQVGATSIADIAYEIEKAGKAGDLETCRNHFVSLDPAYAKLRDYLRTQVN